MKKLICVILLLCYVLLCGCGPSTAFLRKKSQGVYPTAGDFPNTKWVCREIDIQIYMLERDERYMIGVYTVDGKSYRVVASFWFDEFNFEIYSNTQIAQSEYSNAAVSCNRQSCGFIYSNYSFDKENETLVCSLRNYKPVHQELIPQTLTFEKVGNIAQHSDARWCAQSMEMYLDSYSDIEGYLRGYISIEGETYYIHAFEIGNNDYYMLSIENGRINNLISGTTSPLICMYFERDAEQMIAKVSDEYLSNKEGFPYWPYGEKEIVFYLDDLN